MPKMLCLVFVILGLAACSAPASRTSVFAGLTPALQAPPDAADEEGGAQDEDSRPVLVSILLYLPNRVLDLFDIARAGVSVGPGIGIDLTATELLNLTLMFKTSVGVGYQTLRHLPIEAAAYADVGAGPIKLDADPGFSWYRSPGDFRVELYVLLVGAHAALEPIEILDFLVGLIGLDPVEDDY